MTITTKENASGRVSGYYVDGVKVRKSEISGLAINTDEIIYVNYFLAKNNFPAIFNGGFCNDMKVVYTGLTITIMTKTAAAVLGYRVVKNWNGKYSGMYVVEENTEEIATEDTTTEAELIKHNGVSFEGFLATNAGLTIEEYRARKDEQQAEAERRTKIFNLKSKISNAEYTITETSGTLNDIIKNHYRPESDDGSWDEYTAELGDTLATAVSTLNTLKAQLAELEPAIVEDNTDTTTEVEETTEDVIATIDPEIIYKAVKTVGGEVQRTISRGFEKGGKEMWFSFGRRISKTRAAELLAECGFRSIDEFFAAEKVAEKYADEVYWPRWCVFRDQAKFLRNKIWTEVKPCDDNAEVFNLLPDVNTLNDVEDEINADDAVEDKVESYKLTKEQIEKRMSEIAIERGEFYDALEEAEANEDISQSHIDYLKGEIDSLMEEYNALWAQLINIKKAEAKTEVTKTKVKPAKVDRLDDFTAKLAKLKADVNEKQTELLKAQDEHKQAVDSLKNFLGDMAFELKQKLDTIKLDYTITLKKVSGSTYRVVDFSEIYIGAYHIGCDVEFHFEDWKCRTIARYATPAQVETVINMLKATIDRGDEEFTFPTVDELTTPRAKEPDDESEPTEVKHGAKFIEGKFYNDMDWATFGTGKKCFKILKRTACYVTIGDYSPYWKDYLKDDRYKIKTDSDGNEYINYWSGERLCAQFLTVDENIRGSLERAAEIARQKYYEYEREGDKAGMLSEIELYSICTDAIKELEAA